MTFCIKKAHKNKKEAVDLWIKSHKNYLNFNLSND